MMRLPATTKTLHFKLFGPGSFMQDPTKSAALHLSILLTELLELAAENSLPVNKY